jgi:hypothetical protein
MDAKQLAIAVLCVLAVYLAISDGDDASFGGNNDTNVDEPVDRIVSTELRAKHGLGDVDVGAYSLADVRARTDAGDVCVVLSGQVFDLSAWAPSHPGGDAPLLAVSGEDATSQFIALHAADMRLERGEYYIGELVKESAKQDL